MRKGGVAAAEGSWEFTLDIFGLSRFAPRFPIAQSPASSLIYL